MSLDHSKLENLTELPDGCQRARCPACASHGKDRKGEHLIIFADGRYGCAAHQGDEEHRKLIYRQVGLKGVRRPHIRPFRIEAKGGARRWLGGTKSEDLPRLKPE